MKRINKKQSTQTDGSGGAKMSAKNKIETKMQIGKHWKKYVRHCANAELDWRMCHALLTWRFVVYRAEN